MENLQPAVDQSNSISSEQPESFIVSNPEYSTGHESEGLSNEVRQDTSDEDYSDMPELEYDTEEYTDTINPTTFTDQTYTSTADSRSVSESEYFTIFASSYW